MLRTHDSSEHFERAEALNLRNSVHAVLEAIREPSEGMTEAGAKWMQRLYPSVRPVDLNAAFADMIDAALEEG